MSSCEGCGAPIVWAITREGKRAPITLEPKSNGNVLVFRDRTTSERMGLEGDTMHSRTFAGFALDELREQGVPLRLNHFADCPRAEQFRTKRSG